MGKADALARGKLERGGSRELYFKNFLCEPAASQQLSRITLCSSLVWVDLFHRANHNNRRFNIQISASLFLFLTPET
jgi:hypothetical protein